MLDNYPPVSQGRSGVSLRREDVAFVPLTEHRLGVDAAERALHLRTPVPRLHLPEAVLADALVPALLEDPREGPSKLGLRAQADGADLRGTQLLGAVAGHALTHGRHLLARLVVPLPALVHLPAKPLGIGLRPWIPWPSSSTWLPGRGLRGRRRAGVLIIPSAGVLLVNVVLFVADDLHGPCWPQQAARGTYWSCRRSGSLPVASPLVVCVQPQLSGRRGEFLFRKGAAPAAE
mmetsp:Transcript_43129/g.116316  ORF Transcript_43129/g.116316 Transcript_43129/m.116316 type:complete len:233 (+) Transcript_43129:3-701(+)